MQLEIGSPHQVIKNNKRQHDTIECGWELNLLGCTCVRGQTIGDSSCFQCIVFLDITISVLMTTSHKLVLLNFFEEALYKFSECRTNGADTHITLSILWHTNYTSSDSDHIT